MTARFLALTLTFAPGALPPATDVPLIVFSDTNHTRELFRLGPGGCLRGPATIQNEAGDVSFTLYAGSSIPANCDKE